MRRRFRASNYQVSLHLHFPRTSACGPSRREPVDFPGARGCSRVHPRACAPLLQSTTRVKPFICTMPMRLDEGWNQIQFNLSDFTRRAYGARSLFNRRFFSPVTSGSPAPGNTGRNPDKLCRRCAGTNYVETLRVQIHANCRIRRIYFSDRLYSEEELPPEFKLFLPIQQKQ